MKVYLLSFLLITAVFHLKAQTIKGRLTDAKTRQPIGYASLSLVNLSDAQNTIQTTSDSTGNFIFAKLSPAPYLLSAGMIGYQKLSREVVIPQSPREIDLGILKMDEDANLLNAVTITGGRPNFSSNNGQLKVAVASNPFFKATTNVNEVLRRLPGLQVNAEGAMLLSSGVSPTIFVDGKPVNMNPEEIQGYLASLSPENVESIELITQPSSRYDGQYHGIIDIRLKRSASLGLKGIYSLRYQQNQRSMVDNTLSLHHKTQQFAYGFSAAATHGGTYYRYHALQFLQNTNSLITDTRTIAQNNNYNVQARASFEAGKGQAIEAYLRTFQINRNARTNNQLNTMDNHQTTILSQNNGENTAKPKQRNYAGGLNYELNKGNSQLQILSTIAQIDNRQKEDILNSILGSDQMPSHWKTNSSNNIQIRTIQGDYTLKAGTGKLELGGKYASTSTNNNLRYDTLSNGDFHLDPARTNQFSYREQVAAGYFSYGGSFGKFSYSLAIRAEHTATTASSVTDNSNRERNYLKWLPSTSLTYQLDQVSQFSLSYSKRLTRPSFEALNPFRFYYSARHYWIGNPMLQPSTTSLFSLSYSKSALNISLSGGRENDPMVRYPEYDPVTNILIFKGDNLPYRDFLNLRASMPLTITPWWKTSNSLSLFYNKELRPYFGNTFQIPVYNYTLNGSQLFTLKQLTIDLSYNLESKSGNSLYVFAPVRTIDLGLQRSWLRSKLSSKLALQDIFDGGRRRVIFREKSIIDNDFYHDNSTRRLILSLSYSFGGSSYNQKELKRSEEENRVGN
jgi:outer membrane receptor protein involved in Fe transport